MAKQTWKPGNMIYPIPAVMVSVTDGKGQDDIITVAWTGTICTNPPMAYISVRPERFSYHMIKETGEFVINLTTEELAAATDYCGVRSGRDVDKFKETGLTREKADIVKAPMIKEAPVSIECRVKEIRELGSHHMFLADVVAVHADELREIKERLIPFMVSECGRHGVSRVYFMLTDIMEQSTELLFYGEGSEEMAVNAFKIEPKDGTIYLEGVVSRKKQLIPPLMEAAQMIGSDYV